MATRRTATKRLPKSRPVSEGPLLVHRIHALLRTMRCIAQYEDELCTLLHAAERGNTPEPELQDELRSLLEAMPSREYADDLESLRGALPVTFRSRSADGGARKAAKGSKTKAASQSKSRSKPKQSNPSRSRARR